MAKRSEFGKGLTYCLGLFLAHAERWKKHIEPEFEILNNAQLWFNAASDHLYELQIPQKMPIKLQKRLQRFEMKVLDFGHGRGLMDKIKVTEKDIIWALQEAKDLLRIIDKFYGIETQKGSWE